MGITSGIDIFVRFPNGKANIIIEILMEAGWHILPSSSTIDEFEYLPFHDNGIHDWQTAHKEEWPNILEIILNKVINKEEVGISLYYENSGAYFYFSPDSQNINILLFDSERRIIPETDGFTDFSWYLSRLLPPLIKKVQWITNIECSDQV